MKSFVKLHLCHAQENVTNVAMKWQNFKTLRFVKSFATLTHIKLRPCLNNHKSSKTIDLVEAA